jgi:cytochrome c-type biogenesis protein CcmH/NrfG
LIWCADRAAATGDSKLALRLYCAALKRNPRDPPVWIRCGHLLTQAGELAPAEAAYRNAVACDPGAADVWLQLGRLLKLRARIEEAQACYLRAYALDGQLDDALHGLVGLGWSESDVAELRIAAGCTAPASLAPEPAADGAAFAAGDGLGGTARRRRYGIFRRGSNGSRGLGR